MSPLFVTRTAPGREESRTQVRVFAEKAVEYGCVKELVLALPRNNFLTYYLRDYLGGFCVTFEMAEKLNYFSLKPIRLSGNRLICRKTKYSYNNLRLVDNFTGDMNTRELTRYLNEQKIIAAFNWRQCREQFEREYGHVAGCCCE